MGPYLQIMGTVIYVRYPSGDMPFDWHTDGGASLRRTAARSTLRSSIF